MKPAPFAYAKARTLEEAIDLLGTRSEARLLAGGQSLLATLNMRLSAPRILIDINGIADLDRVVRKDGMIEIGALVRHAQAARTREIAEHAPLIARALPHIAHPAIRNRGTVGGSIAHADAAAELPLVLQTLAGEVEVTGPSGVRLVPSEEFFVSHLTSCLEADEIVTEVRFPVTGPGWGAGFAEVAPRHGDYAVCAVACALRVEGGVVVEAHLGAGAVSDRPLRLPAAERALVGSRCDGAVLASAADEARRAVDPSDGMHASAEYRRHLTGVLVSRAAQRAYAMAAG